MRLENEVMKPSLYNFACRVNAVIALNWSQNFPSTSTLQEGVDEVWAWNLCRCTRSGKGYPFHPTEYNEWTEWAEDVCIYELTCDHDQVPRDSGFHGLLWAEVARVLGK